MKSIEKIITATTVFSLILCSSAFIPSGQASDQIAYSSGSTAKFIPSDKTPLESSVSFGTTLPLGLEWTDSHLELDSNRSIWSPTSLKWHWKSGASLTFKRPIPWNNPNKARKLTNFFYTVETTTSIWIYNDTPRENDKLQFEFYTGETLVCSFDFGLNFTGWRAATVSFDSEMQGTPSGPMDRLKIIAPKTKKNGKLWLGDLVLSKIMDSRHRHGDFQVPYVKNASELKEGHWDPIMYWYALGNISPNDLELTDAHRKGFAKLHKKATTQTPITQQQLKNIETQFAQYNIRRLNDGSITGDHIYLIHHLDSAPTIRTKKGHRINQYTTFMLQVAQQWHQLPEKQKNGVEGSRLAEIYCLLSEHLLDQGYAAGSALGTMHHFAYKTRDWAPSVELMQEPLEQRNLLEPMRLALTWYYNCNKIYDPKAAKANMDYLNTMVSSDLLILSLGKNDASKAARLSQFSKWINQMVSEKTPGNKQGFKIDDSLYHHSMHYHGYGMPALTNFIEGIVEPLDGTPFEISPKTYEALKQYLLAASYWNYPHSGFNACGRHPLTNTGETMKETIKILAYSKPGTDSLDVELANLYNSMFSATHGPISPDHTSSATNYPEVKVMNHNASFSLKKAGNTVHVKGWGDGIKARETYGTDNRYGRYASHGTVQILKHTFSHASGYTEAGWDWSRPPGATTLWLPHDILEGTGFYGSGPTQKSHPSGAGSLNGTYAGFLFQLDKTEDAQSLAMKKSVFALGDSLICLGSNISNTSTDYPTVTTVFQGSPLKNDQSELQKSSSDSGTWLIDAYGSGYFIPADQTLKTTSKEQVSRHNKTKEETKGFFHTAWLDHGKTPVDASYRYHILLNASPKIMEDWKTSHTKRIHILQQDEDAHHLKDTKNKIEACAIFKACELKNPKSYIAKANHTCIVLIQQTTDEKIQLSHTNVNIDDIGSQSAEAIITLRGKWALVGDDLNGCKVSLKENNTVLKFSEKRGLSQELHLKQIQ